MLVERIARVFTLGLAAAGTFSSCSLDDRVISTGSGYAGFWIIAGAPGGADDGDTDNAGSNADGSSGRGGSGGAVGSGGSGAAADSGGTHGAGGSQTAIIDGCPDLDADDKGDCTETLVKNANFAADTQSWDAGDDAFIEWSSVNHFEDLPSGSALVSANGHSDTDGMVQRAATQCLVNDSLAQVQVFASVFVKSGQGEGMASVGMFFYASPDCSGSPSGPPLETPGSAPDVWQTLSARQAVPQGTHSALVRLAVSKPFRSVVFKAYFDNILIRAQ
jgi:hypothetical protein